MKLSLAPLPYCWDRQAIFNFYAGLRGAPVDIVYLGESVCAKRRNMRLTDWLMIGEALVAAGKSVVLSTAVRFETESVPAIQRRICTNGHFMVEANNIAAVHELTVAGVPFVIGPYLNVYDDETLASLVKSGARRWVMPMQLNIETLTAVQRPARTETEVFAYGRLPLALSARCLSAWAHNRTRDTCGFVCENYPDGSHLASRGNRTLLVLNGVQVQSVSIHNLITQLDRMVMLGVDVLRLSPQPCDMPAVIESFRDAITGMIRPEDV